MPAKLMSYWEEKHKEAKIEIELKKEGNKNEITPISNRD